MDRRTLGKNGEEYAVSFLSQAGLKIVARNYRCYKGEMDIIAWDQSTLVFVEVRTKSSAVMGWGEESITEKKRRRLRSIAASYLLEKGYKEWPAMRIDLVALRWENKCGGPGLTLGAWIKGI